MLTFIHRVCFNHMPLVDLWNKLGQWEEDEFISKLVKCCYSQKNKTSIVLSSSLGYVSVISNPSCMSEPLILLTCSLRCRAFLESGERPVLWFKFEEFVFDLL